MDFSQQYIGHAYKELYIPPDSKGGYQMPKNFLHIWPRNDYMMIALPNDDGSFTLTLFMPYDKFESITTDDEALLFFEHHFKDAIPLIGRDNIPKLFTTNKTLPLIIIKCQPYHAHRAVIMGDAAHAMVPFYGQGMNAGFEDCFLFDQLLEKLDGDIYAAMESYSQSRPKDAHAICDLALNNYLEMRSHVLSGAYLLRKYFDDILYRIMPNSWIPKYSMVTFTNIPYSEVISRSEQQDKTVGAIVSVSSLAVAVTGLVLAYKYLDVGVKFAVTAKGFSFSRAF